MSYSIDVNGNDNTPEWGYCTVEGCKEEAFPIWLSGGYPDDPDLYLCPTHIGARILHEETARKAYEELATRAEADAAALRDALDRLIRFTETGHYLSDADRAAIAAMLTTEHPGAALLSELEAARKVVEAARGMLAVATHIYKISEAGALAVDPALQALSETLRAYDAAVKARTK